MTEDELFWAAIDKLVEDGLLELTHDGYYVLTQLGHATDRAQRGESDGNA